MADIIKYSTVNMEKLANVIEVGASLVTMLQDKKAVAAFLSDFESVKTTAEKAKEVNDLYNKTLALSDKTAAKEAEVAAGLDKLKDIEQRESVLVGRETSLKEGQRALASAQSKLDAALENLEEDKAVLEADKEKLTDAMATTKEAQKQLEAVIKDYQSKLETLKNL